MGSQTTCKSCGEPIPQNLWVEAPQRRTPCAKCESTERSNSLKPESGTFGLSGIDVELNVVRYPQVLLKSAEKLFESGEYGVAVVVAHTACEVAVERIIFQGFTRSNIPQVADPVDGLLNSYNVSNPKVRSLFDALARKNVAEDKKAIWEKFVRSVTRRNRVVHEGAQPTKVDAQESLDVVGEMVQYLVALIQ